MIPSDFIGSNVDLSRPPGMESEEIYQGGRAWFGLDKNNKPIWVTAWKPSYEDLEALNNGGLLFVRIVSKDQPPLGVFTFDDNDELNFIP